MLGYIVNIQKIAARLLEEKTVDLVIGFKAGTLPMMNQPCVVTRPGDAAQLVWDSHCGVNLANYLTDRKEKIAVVAKGCDSRNIVNQVIEKKITRDQLYIIGVPCKGMLDKRRIAQAVDGPIDRVTETADGRVVVAGPAGETPLEKQDLLQRNCKTCIHRNPVIYDELAGDLVEEQTDVDRYADVREIEALSADAKWAYFEDLLAPCLRCYACRNACPLCYCPTCFVDESRPQWVGKGNDPEDIRTFHLLRAFHGAGRCTDCGACERACPVGIDMRVFSKKLEKDCLDLFGWEAGLSLDERPPLDTFQPGDPNGPIK